MKNLCFITGLAMFFLFSSQALAANEWIYFASNTARDSYYDKNSIVKVNKNVVRIWTKQILSENGKIKTIAKFRGQDKKPNNLDLISYILKQSEIDCFNKRIKDSSMIFYDEKSNILYSSPKNDVGKWDDITPNSFADKLKRIVCDGAVVPQETLVASVEMKDKNHTEAPIGQSISPILSEQGVRDMIHKWLTSWQTGDMATYRSCYDDHFESKNMKIDEWVAYKTNVRNKSSNITIGMDDLKIMVDGNNAQAVFIQTYTSSILKDEGQKTLKLKKAGDTWKIYREVM